MTKLFISRLIIILSFVFSLTAFADSFPQAESHLSSGLTLSECLSIALQHNPLVAIAEKHYEAARARVWQARAFSQPMINYDADFQPEIFNLKKAGEIYFGLSQSFEFPGKRYLRTKIATHEAEEVRLELESLKLELAFQVKEAFYRLLLAQQKLDFDRQNLALAQDFYEKAKVKYENGDVARVEVLRAHVEVSKASNEVHRSQNEVRLRKAALNYLLGRKKNLPLEIQGSLPQKAISFSLDKLKEMAWKFRPEVKQLELSQQKESLRKKQSYLSYMPDFELGLSRHKVVGEGYFWDFTLSFPIPLFFWQPKKGEITEAQANLEAVSKQLQHLKNAIALEVEEAFINSQVARSQIELFQKEILKEANEVYQMMIFSFQQGEISGIELIEARRTLIEAHKAYADALFNYALALATLEKSVGQSSEGGNK